MIELVLAGMCLLLTGIPAVMIFRNLRCFQPLPKDRLEGVSPVSVLIPARNEAAGIAATLEHLLASEAVELEIIVLDDHSGDGTAAVVQQFADRDARVYIEPSRELPPDWNGKQHACWQLSQHARFERWLFLDADVHVSPDAVARLSAHMDRHRGEPANRPALLSAFPHQQTVGWAETAIVPLMHFVLLGFLPIWRMQRSRHPAYSAGCGQMFMTNRRDYLAAGGHAAIRASRHDGIKLPRAYRTAGLMTDVVDGTDLGSVRMYQNRREVFRGVIKNADEALATAGLILPVSLFCLAPAAAGIATVWFAFSGHWPASLISLLAGVLGILPRIVAADRFRQPSISAWMHPLALCMFLVLQWIALGNRLVGYRVAWRGRMES